MTSSRSSWTIYAASKHFDLHHKRLRAILAGAGRLPAGHEAMSANSVEIGGEDVERFLADVAEMMSLTKAREYLNIPRPHDRLLFDAGYLVPFVVGGTDLIKDHGLRKTDLDAFMASLHSRATAPVADGMVPIPAAAKRSNCSAVEIVELIKSGHLTRVALDANGRGYMAILIDPAEIAPLVRLPDHGCLSMREVERKARWSTAVVTALVDGGHLNEDFATWHLPDILARFARAHPRIDLEVTCDFSVNLLSGFGRGLFDLILFKRDPQPAFGGGTGIWSEPLVWAASSRFQPLDDQAALPLVLAPAPDIYRKRALAALDVAGRNWRVVLTSPSLAGQHAAVRAGLGVSVLPRGMIPPDLTVLDRLSNRLPALADAEIVLYAAPGQPSPAAERLASHIVQSLEALRA